MITRGGCVRTNVLWMSCVVFLQKNTDLERDWPVRHKEIAEAAAHSAADNHRGMAKVTVRVKVA